MVSQLSSSLIWLPHTACLECLCVLNLCLQSAVPQSWTPRVAWLYSCSRNSVFCLSATTLNHTFPSQFSICVSVHLQLNQFHTSLHRRHTWHFWLTPAAHSFHWGVHLKLCNCCFSVLCLCLFAPVRLPAVVHQFRWLLFLSFSSQHSPLLWFGYLLVFSRLWLCIFMFLLVLLELFVIHNFLFRFPSFSWFSHSASS